MAYAVLVLAAWGMVFIRLPVWLALLFGLGSFGFGAVLVVLGAAGAYWNSHMAPGNHGAYWTLGTGVLLALAGIALMVMPMLRPPPEP